MTEPTEAAPIALFQHSITVYEEMELQSRVAIIEGSEMLVYEGKLTDLITVDCGLSVPYYTRVTQALKGMGCARQLRRGGGKSSSQWQMITVPTLELFQEYMARDVEPIDETEYAPLQMITDLNKRLQVVEKAVGL